MIQITNAIIEQNTCCHGQDNSDYQEHTIHVFLYEPVFINQQQLSMNVKLDKYAGKLIKVSGTISLHAKFPSISMRLANSYIAIQLYILFVHPSSTNLNGQCLQGTLEHKFFSAKCVYVTKCTTPKCAANVIFRDSLLNSQTPRITFPNKKSEKYFQKNKSFRFLFKKIVFYFLY